MWCFQLGLHKYIIKNVLLNIIITNYQYYIKNIYYSILKKLLKKLYKVLSAYTLFLRKLLLETYITPVKLYSI